MGMKAVRAFAETLKSNIVDITTSKEEAIAAIECGDIDFDEFATVIRYFFVGMYKHEFEFLIGELEKRINEEEDD